MDPKHTELKRLLHKHLEQGCTAKEIILIDAYMKDIPAEELDTIFAEVWESIDAEGGGFGKLLSEIESQAILQRVLRDEALLPKGEGEGVPEPRGRVWPLWAKALVSTACALIVYLGVMWYAGDSRMDPAELNATPYVSERNADKVEPGQNDAVLTTEDGQEVVLAGDAEGVISEGKAFKLVRLASGEIQYQGLASANSPQWHTVTTPRGGQINFILPDGSKVWLNAASSIRFKSDMGHRERKVMMQGEVYFEVEKAEGKLFQVESALGRIEVLGTKFNVNAYDSDLFETALLEGAVRLYAGESAVEMKPKQVATVRADGRIQTTYKENIEDLVAWTVGEFFFDDADAATIAAQLSRWYNVEASAKPSARKVTGKISRNVKLSTMMEMLNYLGMPSAYEEGILIMNAKKQEMPMKKD